MLQKYKWRNKADFHLEYFRIPASLFVYFLAQFIAARICLLHCSVRRGGERQVSVAKGVEDGLLVFDEVFFSFKALTCEFRLLNPNESITLCFETAMDYFGRGSIGFLPWLFMLFLPSFTYFYILMFNGYVTHSRMDGSSSSPSSRLRFLLLRQVGLMYRSADASFVHCPNVSVVRIKINCFSYLRNIKCAFKSPDMLQHAAAKKFFRIPFKSCLY